MCGFQTMLIFEFKMNEEGWMWHHWHFLPIHYVGFVQPIYLYENMFKATLFAEFIVSSSHFRLIIWSIHSKFLKMFHISHWNFDWNTLYFQIVSSVHYLQYFALFPLCFFINFYNVRAFCSAFISGDKTFVLSFHCQQ